MMKFCKFVTLMSASAMIMGGAHAEEVVEEEEDVLVLTDANYVQVVEAHPNLLVEFYAPWCGHCKTLAPEYAAAAGELKEMDPPIRIAKVDATEQKVLGDKYGIKGFPTLKLFRGDVDPSSIVDYDGGRTGPEIVKYMVKKSGPSVTVISTPEELEALKTKNEVVVIAFVDDVEGETRKLFEKVASKDDDNVYVVTSNADMAGGKKVSLYKQFDEGLNHFESEVITAEELTAFVKKNSKPLIMTFSQDKASQIFGGDVNIHLLMFSDESKDYHEKLITAVTEPAKVNQDKMLHIIVPLSEDRILEYFGFKEEDLPAIMLVNMDKGMKKYAFDKKADELSATFETTFSADVTTFEANYFAGSLEAALKSADPVDDSGEAVKIIVGKDFQERVAESTQDVLLEFYAPWCGHCKSLAPKYDELAEKFSDVKSILIAKMDATENEVDHPGVDVTGFPTLIFFPAGDKKNPVVYEGDRDVKGFTAYLKEHAKSFDLDGESHGVSHDEL